MKKSHKKLIIFEIILFFILLLNSFVWNILNGYIQIIFLILVIKIFKKIFGLEKDKHRYIKDIIYEISIVLLIFFMLYYLFGIVIGFVKTNNYYNLYGIFKFIIPTIIIIILKEYLRYNVLSKSEGNNLLIVLSCIIFIFLDITNTIYYNEFLSRYNIFIFIALTLLPAFSNNVICTYFVYKVGFKPNIFYLLIMNLYAYLLPIIPNCNEFLYSIIQFLLPFIFGYRVYCFFEKAQDKQISREYNKKNITSFIIPSIIIMALVYFTSGYFHYYAVAIASGSMTPNINKGDIVIIEKIANKTEIKEGTVIAYKYNGVIVVHRVIKILKENENYYFYTQGDANKKQDNYVVKEDMIIGTVNLKLPYIGYPTVWLNEL